MSEIDTILQYDVAMPEDKRRTLAAFYTPKSIAKIMAEDLIATHFKLLKIDDKTLHNDPLSAMTILSEASFLDMSCGTGVFAYAYLERVKAYLTNYNIAIDLALFTRRMILNDIDESSVNQIRILLKKAFGIDYLGETLSVDALLSLADVPCVKNVLDQGGFDLIMGNPPYFGEKGNLSHFEALKYHPYHKNNYRGKMDYFYFFVHQGIDFLSQNGTMTYINTSYFTTADSANVLRQSIRDKIKIAVIRPDACRFEDAQSIRVIAYTLAKTAKKITADVYEKQQCYKLQQSQLFDEQGNLVIFSPIDHQIINQIKHQSILQLSDIVSVNQGLVSGADKVTRKIQKNVPSALLGAPIFVFDDAPIGSDAHIKPLVKNSDIGAYTLKRTPSKYIVYSDGECLSDNKRWLEHLLPYKSVLEQRREVKSGKIPWYALQWPRVKAMFERPKIIAPQRAEKNLFAYVSEPCYGSADIYFLTCQFDRTLFATQVYAQLDEQTILKALTMYLCSPLVYYWLYLLGKKKARMLELYATPLKHIPILNFTVNDLIFLAKQYDLLLQTADKGCVESANRHIFTSAKLKKTEIERIFSIFTKNKNDE